MINGTNPSRVELSEVSSATLAGADTFILSHETSIGKNPIEATVFLAKAIAEAENVFDYDQAFVNVREEIKDQGDSAASIDLLASTGCAIAFEQRENVDLFICITENGRIARHLSKQKPKQPILACSTNGQTVRQINMSRGVVGYKIPEYLKQKTEDLVNLILTVAQKQLICNLDTSKVLIFIGQNEDNERKEMYTFKLVGEEKQDDDEDEEEEVVEQSYDD